MERILGSLASAEKGTIRLPIDANPCNDLNVPTNARTTRIVRLPPGVILLKPSMGTFLNHGPNVKNPSILKLPCVNPQKVPLSLKKEPVVLFSGSKLVKLKGGEPPVLKAVDTQILTESSRTIASGFSQNNKLITAVTVVDQNNKLLIAETGMSQNNIPLTVVTEMNQSRKPVTAATGLSQNIKLIPKVTEISQNGKPIITATGISQITKPIPKATGISQSGKPVTAATGISQNGISVSIPTGISKNGIPVPLKKPEPKPKPWWREPRPLWKSKEPVVMYSGCKPEDLEPKKKKDEPPESLPCPKKLQDVLPQNWKYHISSFEELSNPENFKAEVRVNLSKKEEALQWLQDFEDVSGTNFRIAKTFKENSLRITFKKCYKCHKNTYRKDRVKKRESKRNLGCEARLSITIKNKEMKSSADKLLGEFPCVIGIYHDHCHSLTAPDALRYRRPLPEVKEKLSNMFRAKITPSAALRLHLSDLKKEYGDRFSEVIKDGARCPRLAWCYRLYYETVGKKVKDGKKKSTRKSSYKKKTASVPRHVSGQILQENPPVVVNFNSPDGVSSSFTISINDNHTSDEMQKSINSLYQYDFMSKNSGVEENEVTRSVQIVNVNESAVDLGANTEAISHVANNSVTEAILDHSETATNDFIGNSNMLENDESDRVFEDGCEMLDPSASPNAVQEAKEENIIGSLSNSTSLDQSLRMDVEQAKQDLLRVFNDISSKLVSKPQEYLSAVKQFTSQYDRCQSGSYFDPVTALNEIGSNMSTNPNPLSSSGVSSLMERLIDKRESSVCSKAQTGSPKRKVLVLRMDPNKFNQILGKVGKDSNIELTNI